LADLASIKKSADEFLSKADRLDVLVHNAGVMTPPAGSKTKLGHDLEMGTNCLGPFLFNHYLEPVLKRTAANADRNSVRIVWLSSMIAVGTPPGGIIFDGKTGNPKVIKNAMENYMESKVGNLFLASEAAKRLGSDGIISVATNPGLMKTELQRHSSPVQGFIMGVLFKGPKYGAYTELFSALSPAISSKNNGAFVIPWGRLGEVPPHIAKGMKSTTEGGTGLAEKFWEWCERETKPFW
jgi:retinol dehydrogenase-12